MRRALQRLVALVSTAIAIALWPAAPASAHPLGNFTVNVYGGVVVQPDAVVVDYVVDMAEIPAFRERRTIDVDLDDRVDAGESSAYGDATCASLAEGLSVRIEDRAVPIRATAMHALAFPAGSGGLPTMRLECRLMGEMQPIRDGAAVTFADRNFPDSIGCHEVTLAGDGVTLVGADVPDSSVSDRLTSYPQDELPLDVRRATASVTPGGARLPPAALSSTNSKEKCRGAR